MKRKSAAATDGWRSTFFAFSTDDGQREEEPRGWMGFTTGVSMCLFVMITVLHHFSS